MPVRALLIAVGDAEKHVVPEEVADQLDLPLAEVHEALAYYYNNVDEIETYRRRREELLETLKKESRAPDAIER